mgnify:CR=1 FL=1
MKKVVSLILVVLTIITVMSVTSVPAYAIRDKEGKLPLATSAIATLHNSAPQISATTISEENSSTYIIIAVGVFAVGICLGMLIGYNIKKKEKPVLADGNENKDEE